MTTPTPINPHIMRMEYAVRGPIPQCAADMACRGETVIPCNIGNPQALGQKPISYYREVLSLVEAPSRLAREKKLRKIADSKPGVLGDLTSRDFASDEVIAMAEEILTKMKTGLGAYTESKGPLFIREAIARYIDRRDEVELSGGVPADPDSIFLTNGASEAAKYIIDMLISGPDDGIMIPIPQYPLYSAAIMKSGGVQVNYYPDEDQGWTLNRDILDESLAEARSRNVNVKAIVVINPANPTGAVLPEASVREIVDFAAENELAIIADEVYQDNTYGAGFVSFAKIVDDREIPLFSLHSTSKGFIGECGRRGGYVELRHPPRIAESQLKFQEVLLTLASVSLCSNTVGQVTTHLMVSPPQTGAERERFITERDGVLSDLHAKATMIREAFDEMEGVECFGRTGAMYLFPRLNRLPAGTTDFEYCMGLLRATGLCTVNGLGFGQRAGTNHLRIAFLPPRDVLESVLPRWIEFHNTYVNPRTADAAGADAPAHT